MLSNVVLISKYSHVPLKLTTKWDTYILGAGPVYDTLVPYSKWKGDIWALLKGYHDKK